MFFNCYVHPYDPASSDYFIRTILIILFNFYDSTSKASSEEPSYPARSSYSITHCSPVREADNCIYIPLPLLTNHPEIGIFFFFFESWDIGKKKDITEFLHYFFEGNLMAQVEHDDCPL